MGSFTRKVHRKQARAPLPLDVRLREFERVLVKARNFLDIENYFHSNFATDKEFLAASDEREHASLLALVRALLQSLTGTPEIAGVTLLHLPARDLWHGFMFPRGGGMALIFYSGAVKRGLLCYTTSLADKRTHHIRFTMPEEVLEDLDLSKCTMYRRPRSERPDMPN
jgi:hypothetical protein